MRVFLLFPVLFALTGCMSEQTKADIEKYSKEAEKISAVIEEVRKEDPNSPRLPILYAQLAAAKEMLERSEAAGEQEIKDQIAKGAEITEGVVENVGKPIAGAVFPPALIILNLIGAAAGAMRKIGQKEE